MSKIFVYIFFGILVVFGNAFNIKTPLDELFWSSRIDEVTRMGCHNCYETQYSLTFKGALDKTQIVEIDFWGPSSNYEVRHDGETGNTNNCGNGNQGLGYCMDDIVDWMNENPGHPIIMVFLDKKEIGLNTNNLDIMIKTKFTSNQLFTPCDLAATKGDSSCTNGFRNNNNNYDVIWPTNEQVKNKIMFIMTATTNTQLGNYWTSPYTSRKMFIAPIANFASEVTNRIGITGSDEDWIIFINTNKNENEGLIDKIRKNNMMGRFWESNDNNMGWLCDTVGKNMQIVTYHNLNAECYSYTNIVLNFNIVSKANTVLDSWGGLVGYQSAAFQANNMPTSKNRVWALIPASFDGYYRIRSHQDTVLDSWGGLTGFRSAAFQSDDSPSSNNRLFKVVSPEFGWYRIVSKQNTCLDNWSGLTGYKSAAFQPDNSPNSNNRKWKFVPQDYKG